MNRRYFGMGYCISSNYYYIVLFFSIQLGLFLLLLLSSPYDSSRANEIRLKWANLVEPVKERDGRKICFATVELKGPDKSGGIGASIHSLALLLSNNGFRVSLLYAGGSTMSSSDVRFWKEAFQAIGIKFFRIEDPPRTITLFSTMTSFKIYEWLRDHEEECEMVHFHDYFGIGYFSLLAKKMGLAFQNTVFQIDGHAPHAFAREGAQRLINSVEEMSVEWMEKQSIQMADIVVAPSRYIVHWMEEQWKLRIPGVVRIMQNVLPKVEESEWHGGYVNEIVYYGKFDRLKGVDIFLKAIDILSRSTSAWEIQKVTIIGLPMEFDESYINERAKLWDIPFQILTHKDSDFTMNYLRKHNTVVVYPSRAENSPTVILESASNGVCFMASNVGGIPELLSPESRDSHLFNPNGKDLAKKLLDVLTNGCKKPILLNSLQKTREMQKDWHNEVFHLSTSALLRPMDNLTSACVVIPFHNRLTTLPQALESLQQQTYTNFEVVIVDDGSDELNVKQKLDKIVEEFKGMSIRVIHQENKYLSAARNTGARHCRSDWIMFLDDDDIAKPHELETYIKVARNIEAEALTGCVDVFSGTKPTGKYQSRYVGSGPSLELNFFKNALGSTANLFIKRTVFEEIGGFAENTKGFEDWELAVRLLIARKNFQMIPESLYWYRNSPNSMMKTMDSYPATKFVMQKYLNNIPEDFHPILNLAWYLTDKQIAGYSTFREG